MKIVCAQFRHETNTFSPLPTGWEAFGTSGPLHGSEAIRELRSSGQPSEAFIKSVEAWGGEVIMPIAGRATPSGPVLQVAFDRALHCIIEAVSSGCDAVLLDLHGSMVTTELLDADGELVRQVRAAAGNIPIGVALDLHANVSQTLSEQATVIAGYKTYPHIDMRETGQQVASLVHRTLCGEIEPKITRIAVPFLPHTLCQNTAVAPMRPLVDSCLAAERDGRAECVSIFTGFYSCDVPHAGVSIVAVADGEGGEEVARSIAQEAWQSRADFIYQAEPLSLSVKHAKSAHRHPVILSDHCDNPSAGSTQDCMTVLAEVLRQKLPDVIVGSIRDPEAVETLIAAGLGAEMTLDIGGKTDMPALELKGEPLRLTGVVEAISDGTYTIDGPVFTGMKVNMGRTVCFASGPAKIVITERNTEPFDLNVFRSVGIEPTKHRYILLKSKMHYRAAYEPIAADIIECNGTGVGTSDLSQLRYRQVRRPIYPLDTDTIFDPNERVTAQSEVS